jgi:hypothetical protein
MELDNPIPQPLQEAIRENIAKSSAVFVFWTSNVVYNATTRDNIIWEVGQAHGLQKPIYVFKERGAALPMMLDYVTTYHEFNVFNPREVQSAFDRALIKAKEIVQKDATGATYTLFLLALGIGAIWWASQSD